MYITTCFVETGGGESNTLNMAGHRVLDDYFLAITLLVTVAYQLIGFSIAFTCKFDKLTGKSNFTP